MKNMFLILTMVAIFMTPQASLADLEDSVEFKGGRWQQVKARKGGQWDASISFSFPVECLQEENKQDCFCYQKKYFDDSVKFTCYYVPNKRRGQEEHD